MTPRTQVFVAASILLLASAVDFMQRIYTPRFPATRESNIEAPDFSNQPLSLASARERLQSWLPSAESASQGESATLDDEVGAGAVLPPDRADLAGLRFILRGIFDAGPPFAVIDVMSSAGGEIEQHRLSAGDEVKGVRVAHISDNSVSLSDGEDVIQLALFIDPTNDIIPANENDK